MIFEPSPLYQVLVCGTHVLSKLCQFWNFFQINIAWDSPYIANIGGMRLRLSELQENNKETKLLKGSAGLSEDWENIEEILQYWELLYFSEIICSEVISCHHDNLLARHFGFDKTRELVGRKYYWSSLRRDVEAYIRGCDICLTSKAVCYKPYGDVQSLLVLIHQWKNLSMNFVTSLLLSAD